ncbi:sulfate permease, SulP family [Prevotella communis]|uniref:Sulfate permease, SulP family n=1 Tax=Prevotella communis TaxID=2913614 RepID=A0A1H0G133_9BACT|nr:sulfate permease [Prevotella communis]UKK60352.1 sulfate permease [Prevotella communis]SDG44120.1 sulfate permease, SulP family [Prevotella communis]SDO00551.1 sulfate permease, SulP family [Prevotella communis]
MKTLDFKPKLVSAIRNYNKQTFMADLMAGLIVGIVALPLAIAFGIASGVSPEKGIITAIVAGFAISALGGSKVQIGGPTGAFIVIVAGIINQYGIQGLTIATLMAGVFLIGFGLLRLGTIIKYIPYPIIVGFTSGIAVTIFTTQVKDLLGMQMDAVPSDFIEKWIAYFQNLTHIDPWSAGVGLVSVAIIASAPKFSKRIPGSLIAIIVMTVVVLLLKQYAGVTSIETIGDRFNISSQLPDAVVPELSWETIKGLVAPALTIAILGAIESLLSATVADGVIGDHHNSNTELIGQGVANIVSPIFGGIPATGAIARTMTNINNGGRTPIAGIVHAVVLLLIFLFLMPLAQYIPMACLAGVLVVVSYGMSGWRSFTALMHNPKSDITVLLLTFFLTIIFDLTVAIEVGIVCACLLFMKRMSETTDVKAVYDEIDLNEDADMERGNLEHLSIPKGVEVYEINGPYFFGAGNKFEDLMGGFGDRPKVRIIRMRKVPFIDSTGLHNLENMCLMSQKEGITVVLSGVNEKVEAVLRRNNFHKLLGQENICNHIDLALARANEIVG